MSLLDKALKKDSLIDSEENGKHSGQVRIYIVKYCKEVVSLISYRMKL